MDLPTYLEITDENVQNIYQQELNQTLRNALSNNGWTVPQITHEQLTITPVYDENTQVTSTLASLMPNGSLWFVTNATPPCYVGKISDALVKFTTTAYP